MIKRKLILAAIISLFAVFCFSGCSGITVDGKKLRCPTSIILMETMFSSHIEILTEKQDIEEAYSFFDGAEFTLSEESLTENDGDIFRAICADINFGDNTYWFRIIENGKAECYFGDKHYITECGAVDYNALKEYIIKLND